MLTILRRGRRELVTIDPAGPDLPSDAIWLDLHEPTPEEIAFVEPLPRHRAADPRGDARDRGVGAGLRGRRGALFLPPRMLVNSDRPPPAKTEITFILKAAPGHPALRRPQPFRIMPARIERHGAGLGSGLRPCSSGWSTRSWRGRPTCSSGPQLDIDDPFGRDLRRRHRPGHQARAPGPARGDRADRPQRRHDADARANACSPSRACCWPSQPPTACRRRSARRHRLRVKAINRDVASLSDHATFLASKIDLLLNATLGMINIEQNDIIKIFSVLPSCCCRRP